MDIYEINPELDSAKKRAFRILERMPRTEKQLKDKLIGDGKYTEEIIDTVIAFLKEYHYLDDRQYSKDYINSRKNSKGLRVLFFELKNKGVSEGIISELKEEYSDMDTSVAIRKLIDKKGIDPKTEDRKQREKLYRFLLSRGFSYSDISNAVTELTEDY